jgi:hypothetical protein
MTMCVLADPSGRTPTIPPTRQLIVVASTPTPTFLTFAPPPISATQAYAGELPDDEEGGEEESEVR